MNATLVAGYKSDRSDLESASGLVTISASPRLSTVGQHRTRPISPGSRRTKLEKRELRDFRVLRRLSGFLAETQGEEWRVIFVENGVEIPYILPAERLRKVGITLRFQPFEMDELESTLPDIAGKIYRFRPLAAAKDAYLETIPLDKERERKRNLIFDRFGKPKD